MNYYHKSDAGIFFIGPDPDDVLDEGRTDSTGHFDLEGSTRELTSIDPVLKIYHDCDDGIKVRYFFLE